MGLVERVKYHVGDYFKDDFPEGGDVTLLSNILHGYGPETCVSILKKVHDYLPHGGAIIINDTILDEYGCGPENSTLLSFYYLLITEEGRNYTLSEYKDMLKNAGFINLK